MKNQDSKADLSHISKTYSQHVTKATGIPEAAYGATTSIPATNQNLAPIADKATTNMQHTQHPVAVSVPKAQFTQLASDKRIA